MQVIVGVGLNVANEEPSTCINVRLRERARQLGHPDASSLSISPEVRELPTEVITDMPAHQFEKTVRALWTWGWQHLRVRNYLLKWTGACTT